MRGRLLRATLAAAGMAALLSACDKDPSAPSRVFPTLSVVNADVIGRQEAIRIFFSGDSLSAATALDPANFVVVNECTGLRVPGSLRIGRGPTGDTLVFTPTQALPYLTGLGVRVQNLLTSAGTSMGVPQTFELRTEAPPVSDLSWHFLESPTNDFVTGVNFVDRNTGYAVTTGGSVYRSTDGGVTFPARYKDLATTSFNDVRAFGDTVYVVGARQVGSDTRFGLFRSTDAAASFALIKETTPILYTNSMTRVADGHVVGVMGGIYDVSYVYRFDSDAGTLTRATGIPGGEFLTTGVDLSRETADNAVATFLGYGSQEGAGVAVRSTDGGLSFTTVALPEGTFGLQGTGFINEHEALILGDSSVVLRLDVATGAVTPLGAAQGIPQTIRNAPNDFTTFTFYKARFAPGSQLGFIIGSFTRRQPGKPDLVNGVLLMTRDGGQTFVRQGISGASDNGLGFAPTIDLQVLAEDFAVLSGSNGLLAARTTNEDRPVAVCSLNQPQ